MTKAKAKDTAAKSNGAPTGEKEQSFDGILQQLQQIVEQLEQPDLPLEASLEAFERGVALSRRGQAILDAAEKRVEVLLKDGSRETLAE